MGEEIKSTLQAGFAKIDITPDFPVGLGGYSDAETRISKGVVEKVYATCIALTDQDETILIYTVDTCALSHDWAEKIRAVVTEATGIAGEKIFCAATHGHNCPSLPVSEKYVQLLFDACVAGAKQALGDRAPAKIMAAKKHIPGMNFVRHVILANGKICGNGWQKQNSPVVGFAGSPDDEMVLVKFAREEKKDILLINWQGHPDSATPIGYEMIAPSWVGPLRDTVAVGSGMEVAYFTGADGNMVMTSLIPAYRHGMQWRRYGVHMGTVVLDLLPELQEVEGTGIKTSRVMVEVDVDHSWDHMVPQADEVFNLWKSTDYATGTKLAEKYNMSGPYQARAIRDRAKMPMTTQLEANAFRVGGVGFTTGTYEMFSENGIQVKGGSPYPFTMVLTGNHAYIPCERAFVQRSYESDTGLYGKGAAEKMVDKYLEMLQDIQE